MALLERAGELVRAGYPPVDALLASARPPDYMYRPDGSLRRPAGTGTEMLKAGWHREVPGWRGLGERPEHVLRARCGLCGYEDNAVDAQLFRGGYFTPGKAVECKGGCGGMVAWYTTFV